MVVVRLRCPRNFDTYVVGTPASSNLACVDQRHAVAARVADDGQGPVAGELDPIGIPAHGHPTEHLVGACAEDGDDIRRLRRQPHLGPVRRHRHAMRILAVDGEWRVLQHDAIGDTMRGDIDHERPVQPPQRLVGAIRAGRVRRHARLPEHRRVGGRLPGRRIEEHQFRIALRGDQVLIRPGLVANDVRPSSHGDGADHRTRADVVDRDRRLVVQRDQHESAVARHLELVRRASNRDRRPHVVILRIDDAQCAVSLVRDEDARAIGRHGDAVGLAARLDRGDGRAGREIDDRDAVAVEVGYVRAPARRLREGNRAPHTGHADHHGRGQAGTPRPAGGRPQLSTFVSSPHRVTTVRSSNAVTESALVHRPTRPG